MKNRINRRDFLRCSGTLMAGSALLGFGLPNKESKDLAKTPVTGRVIDAHLHVRPETIRRCIERMDDNYISYGINIGITGDEAFYRFLEAQKPYQNRLGTMYAFDWSLIQSDKDFFEKAPDMLERAVENGAIGLKNFKELGLKVKDRDGSLLRIDDPRLFPIWERAERLNTIVAFHTSDPKAFFEPWNPQNERWEELELHPEWSFADRSKYPSRKELFEQRNNVIRQFPNLTFHGCHVANNSEEISVVSQWLDEFPNLYIDISARLGELGRHPAKEGHKFFTRHQNRIMFGTDRMFYPGGDVQGAGPQKMFTKAEDNWFYETHWRYLQTNDKQFNHPTPVQGDWKIDGIGLSKDVLRKIYWDNAYKLYNLKQFNVSFDSTS